MKKFTTKILILLLGLFVGLQVHVYAQEVEPNDNVNTGSPMMLNGSSSGNVSATDVSDYHEIILDNNGTLTASAEIDAGLSVRVYIYNKLGSQLAAGNSVSGPGISTVTSNCLAQDTVYVLVLRNSGAGDYALSNSFTSPVLSEDSEPNDVIASTNVFLEPNDNVTGHLGYTGVGISDSYDYYGLLAGDDGNITITAQLDATLNGRLYLYYKNGAQIAISSSGTGELTATAGCLANDTIYALVFRNSGCGSYDMNFTVDTPPTHDQDVEPNNIIPEANVFLAPDESVQGRLGYVGVGISDSYDYYGLIAGDDGNITITAQLDQTLNGRLYLYYKNGAQIAISSSGTGELSATASCLANDTIYALAFRNSGCGSYDMTFTVDTPPTHDQDVEPNNIIAEANVFLAPNESVQGRLGYVGVGISDSYDYYGLIVGDDGNITISAQLDSTLHGRLYLYYKNGAQIAISSSGTGELSTTANCLANDTIYALAFRNSGCGSYDMTFTVDTPPTHDQDVESNNVIAEANVFLAPNESVQGRLGYVGVGISDSYDYFGLIPGDDGNVTVTAQIDATLNARLYLYYKNGAQIAISSAGTGELSTTAFCVANDTIYALVFRNSGCGSYDMTFTHDPPTYSNDDEPNNSIALASPMAVGANVEGHLGYNGVGISDASDYYSFEIVQAPFDLNAKITMTETLAGRLYLYNSSGSQLAISASQTGEFELDYTITTAGTYYILVFRNGGCGSYKLGDLCSSYPMVEATPPGPLLKCPDQPLILSATAGLSTYAWYNGSDIVGNSQTFSATSSGDYTVIGYDINGCPDTSNVVVISALNCDDGDPCTDDFCDTEGGCSNIYSGDDDGDGTCNNLDLCPDDPNKIDPGNCGCGAPEPNESCDDGNPNTIGDTVQDDCSCVGVLEFDCPMLGLNIGDDCDDNDSDTENDIVGDDCVCSGTLIDSDGDGITDSQDNCPFDANTDQADLDGDLIGDECDEDIDGDGDLNEDDCDPYDDTIYLGADCDDNDSATVGDEIQPDCTCAGTLFFDCTELQLNIGDDCDDGDDTTINDIVNDNCQCAGESIFDCPDLQANVGDDCDDGNDDLFPGTVNDLCECEPGVEEFDCPSLQLNIGDDCDDGDMTTTNDAVNDNCECVGESIYDCPDLQANVGDECDDGNDDIFPGTVNDLCECEPGMEEFDCPNLQLNIGDTCNDGNPNTINDSVSSDCICIGDPTGDGPPNDNPTGAFLNTPDRLWGVPGWDSYNVGCATLSMQSCDGSNPTSDSWYKFIAQAENQGILARANPSDGNAPNVDIVIQVFDANLDPLTGVTDGTCAVDRSCFNNVGNGQIERAVPTGLTIGELYYYRVYDANGEMDQNCSRFIDTKVKTYASHPVIDGCDATIDGSDHSWTIENPENLYNIPPVPVIDVRMAIKDSNGDVVATSAPKNPNSPGGLTFDLSDFPSLETGDYTVHAQNHVKMMANGCVSAFWSQLGPDCALTISRSESEANSSLSSLSDPSNISFTIYPNPNSGDQLTISLMDSDRASETMQIFILDSYGKMIHQESVVFGDQDLQKVIQFNQELSSGLYFVQINSGTSSSFAKLIVE